MTEQELQAIEERWAKAEPGPWRWDVNKSCKFVSLESRRFVVMGFKRYGMGGAQPTFLGEFALDPAETLAVPRKANHPNFDMDIDHPCAQAIAHAPTDIALLLAEVRRLNRMVDKAVDYFCKMPCGDCPCEEMCSVIDGVPPGQTCEQTICKYLESEVDK